MGLLGRFLNSENGEILFFILVYLLLFNGNIFGRGHDPETEDHSIILFFIILFLLLFFNGEEVDEVC